MVAGAVVTVVLELSEELYHYARHCNSHLAQQLINNAFVKHFLLANCKDLKSCSGQSLLSISAIEFLATPYNKFHICRCYHSWIIIDNAMPCKKNNIQHAVYYVRLAEESIYIIMICHMHGHKPSKQCQFHTRL